MDRRRFVIGTGQFQRDGQQCLSVDISVWTSRDHGAAPLNPSPKLSYG